MTRKPAAHGTHSGYAAHSRRGEEPCDPCREARRTYIAERRANPEVRARTERRELALLRAKTRLAAEYPERLAELLAEELAALAAAREDAEAPSSPLSAPSAAEQAHPRGSGWVEPTPTTGGDA